MTTRDKAINEAIREALLSQRPRVKTATVAESVGIPYYRLSNLANGKVYATVDELDRLRRYFKLPDYWPGSPEHLNGANKGELVSLSGTPLVNIPVVGNASAGGGLWNVDTELNMVAVPESIAYSDTIGFVVEGDSMMPMLEEFDTAVFRKAARKVHGYVYLVKVEEEGFFVKLVAYDRGDWYLVSLNEKYPPLPMPPGTEFLGVLVGYYRVRGTRELFEMDREGLRPFSFDFRASR